VGENVLKTALASLGSAAIAGHKTTWKLFVAYEIMTRNNTVNFKYATAQSRCHFVQLWSELKSRLFEVEGACAPAVHNSMVYMVTPMENSKLRAVLRRLSWLHVSVSAHCKHFVSRAQPLGVEGVRTPKNFDGPPQLFDEECDYRYVTDCRPRNWVYLPYFVLYNNLDQGIGPQLWKRGCAPVSYRIVSYVRISST